MHRFATRAIHTGVPLFRPRTLGVGSLKMHGTVPKANFSSSSSSSSTASTQPRNLFTSLFGRSPAGPSFNQRTFTAGSSSLPLPQTNWRLLLGAGALGGSLLFLLGDKQNLSAEELTSSDNNLQEDVKEDQLKETTSDTPQEEEATKKEDMVWTIFKLLFETIKEDWLLFIATVAGTILTSAIKLMIPRSAAEIIQTIESIATDNSSSSTSENLKKLTKPCLKFLGIVFLQTLCSWGSYTALSKLSDNVSNRIRIKVFEALIHQDMEVHDRVRKGEQISRMSSEIQEIRVAFKHFFSLGLRSVASLIGGIASMALISPKLTGLIVLVVPSMVLIGSLFAKFLRRVSRMIQNESAKATALANESLSNIKTVRAYGNEEKELARYRSKLESLSEMTSSYNFALGLFQSISSLANIGIGFSVLSYGGYLVTAHELERTSLASFMAHGLQLQSTAEQLSILWDQMSRASGSLDRIVQLLNTPPSIPLQGGLKLPNLSGNISFDSVDFHYSSRPSQTVLSNFTLDLPSNKVIALVGKSGSGKSTALWLLERFYDVTGGSITVDNVDLRSLDPTWWRKQIGFVSQEPELFKGTIYENLLYGRPEASREEVIEAAKRANCHEFISSFPEGYQTPIGEHGAQLSGGQKQRLAIARALLKNPKIVILDEATSSLDSESEEIVQKSLDQLTQGRTTLVVAHRLSTVRNADCIVVLHLGRIVESGTHQELMEKTSGIYRRLVERQIPTRPPVPSA